MKIIMTDDTHGLIPVTFGRMCMCSHSSEHATVLMWKSKDSLLEPVFSFLRVFELWQDWQQTPSPTKHPAPTTLASIGHLMGFMYTSPMSRGLSQRPAHTCCVVSAKGTNSLVCPLLPLKPEASFGLMNEFKGMDGPWLQTAYL